MWISFVIGLSSGILSSLIFWFVTTILLRPRLCISNDIQIITDENGHTLYKLKIQNQGFKRNAYDIRTYVRIRYRGTYLSIELPMIPVLKCKGHGKNDFNNERMLPFKLSHIRKSKIDGYGDAELKNKYKNDLLTFEDFEGEDTCFEVVVTAYDGISSASCKVLVLDYNYKQLIAATGEGNFEEGSLKFVRNTNAVPNE